MGGAIMCSLISAYFLLSTYFLTTQSYKRMRLTTRVYGISQLSLTLKMVKQILYDLLTVACKIFPTVFATVCCYAKAMSVHSYSGLYIQTAVAYPGGCSGCLSTPLRPRSAIILLREQHSSYLLIIAM